MRAPIIAAVGIFAAGGGAFAQTPLSPVQVKQLACISDHLIGEKVDASIARVYASGDEQGEEYEANIKAMDVAMLACQHQYNWSNDQTNLAAQIAMFQIVLDNFSLALSGSKGVTESAFDQIGTVVSAMTADDRNILMDGGWRENDALLRRVSDRLIAAGLPSDSTVLAFAFLIMEAKLVVTYSTMDWAELTH